ncbi:DNA gyrase inhibitor YacG [Nitrospira sp. KM1]|uniref:DNA gyrase inhibitor YacG n=1 Tax=Nitrospira sp. KM1 TaxID=1936990 RepID=UPI0013A736EC|nr:DNA gyrase inhibitor YacG [Nitrospira sp. KM1]BCA54861.1 DNA gyrase inhibitor YacG [Nitrospira sp. KM1]
MNCPICRKATSWDGNPWRPFCSERCQLTDLGSWAMEEYRVPGPNLTMELPSENAEAVESPDDEWTGNHGKQSKG